MFYDPEEMVLQLRTQVPVILKLTSLVLSKLDGETGGAGGIDVQFAVVEAGFFCVSGLSHWSQSLGHHTFQNKRERLNLLLESPYLKSAYLGR